MVDVLREDEDAPASYPSTPTSGLSIEAAVLDPAPIWHRIEQWIAHRWGERTVTWYVQGPGEWVPRLKPASIDTTEVWKDAAWQTVTLEPTPLGYLLDAETYRVTATVGSTETPPAPIQEAYARLAEYVVHVRGDSAAGMTSVTDGDFSFQRSANAAARALQYSGAGDLLRRYRR